MALIDRLWRKVIVEGEKQFFMAHNFVFLCLVINCPEFFELFMGDAKSLPVDVIEARNPANRSLFSTGEATYMVDNPLEHTHILVVTRPDELAIGTFAKPIDMEDAIIIENGNASLYYTTLQTACATFSARSHIRSGTMERFFFEPLHSANAERPFAWRKTMFVRNCWKPGSEEELWKFIDSYGWAILINNGDDGPYATNLPLILDRSGARPMLVGHIAEGNEHALALRSANAPTLAVFQGPSSYVTPSWYPNRDMPSTYYYTSVHCYGRVRIQTEEALRRSLDVLTERMESQFPAGWKTSEIPPYDITRRLKYIKGFELDIERIEGKFKLGQDEPIKDAMAVGHRLAESPDNNQRELSRLVFEYNKDRVES